MSSPSSIRSLERGLLVMRSLNTLGPMTISETAKAVDLPRQTVSRILFFLKDLGYVLRRVDDKRFEIAEYAMSLSDGLQHTSWIRSAAAPVMEDLCSAILWPVAIARPRRANMEILWDTDALSPLVMRAAPIGLKFPLVTSISGRVYLANCNATQRATLIQSALGENPSALNNIDLSAEMLDRHLDDIQARGFYCDQMPHKGHSSLAAPIMDGSGVRAVLDIRFPVRSLSVKEASTQFAEKVMASAKKISASLKGISK